MYDAYAIYFVKYIQAMHLKESGLMLLPFKRTPNPGINPGMLMLPVTAEFLKNHLVGIRKVSTQKSFCMTIMPIALITPSVS
jgi:hypothetical protein